MSPSPQQDNDGNSNSPADAANPNPTLIATPANPPLVSGAIAVTTLVSGSSSGLNSADSSSSSTATQRQITVPMTAPTGGITLTNPASLAGVTSLFKIYPTPATRADGFFNSSQNAILFGWNVTGAILEPTSLSVRAVCDNGYTYPIGGPTPAPTTGSDTSDSSTGGDGYDDSGLVPYNQTLVTWDPVAQQARHPSTPLPVGVCTLQIFDPARSGGIAAAPRPGYVSPNQAALSFALYTGEAYTPFASGMYEFQVDVFRLCMDEETD
ncbi:hypothetical protein MD484_g7462, partial [Candolleomyces efflorescens]